MNKTIIDLRRPKIEEILLCLKEHKESKTCTDVKGEGVYCLCLPYRMFLWDLLNREPTTSEIEALSGGNMPNHLRVGSGGWKEGLRKAGN